MKAKTFFTAVIISILLFSQTKISAFPYWIKTSSNLESYKLQTLSEDDWTLCYESDKIYIYERWIKKQNGLPLRERKGVMVVNSNVANAVYSITNVEVQKKWMKNVQTSKMIAKKSDTCWFSYTMFELPWPLDNRDVISENHLKVSKLRDYAEININSTKNLIRETEGISRITNYKASWVIKKVNETKIIITFTATSDSQQIAPASILDPIMRRTFQKNLLNLRNLLEVKLLVKM